MPEEDPPAEAPAEEPPAEAPAEEEAPAEARGERWEWGGRVGSVQGVLGVLVELQGGLGAFGVHWERWAPETAP